MVNRTSKVARVKLTRAKRPAKNEIPVFYKEPLRQRFGYSYEGSWADIDSGIDEPHATFCANTLSVAVSRGVGAMFEDQFGVSVALHLELQAGTVLNCANLSVDTVLEMTLDDPFGFGRTAVYDTLDCLGDRGYPPDVNQLASDADADEEWRPTREASETMGDVRHGPSGTAAEYPGIQPVRAVQVPCDHSVHNAELAFGTAPHDKYEALAGVVQRAKKKGPVLVIGDHPGTLARALVAKGIDVVGVDPRNREEDHPGGHRFGRRRLIKMELMVQDVPDNLSEVDWGAVVADTTCDDEEAEVSTARNLAFCRLFAGEGRLLIAQTRSVPLVDGVYDALRLPGHSRQGCELYVIVGNDGGMHQLAYSRVERHDGTMGFVIPNRDSLPRSIWDLYFEAADSNKVTTHFLLPDHNWYHFVVSRFFLESQVLNKGWVDDTILGAASPLELYANLVEYFELDDNRRSDLRSLFEGQRVTSVGGVSRGLLERVPTLRHVMAKRYSALSALCVSPDCDTDGGVVAMFADPRAGVLLRGLSELRQVLDYDLMIARFLRVLPYESMSVLASKSLFTLVHHYVSAVRTVVGKPLHTWELQWLLWTLSVNGARSEKIAYVLAKLRSVFFRPPTGRRATKVSQAKPALDGFLSRLDDLRMRSAYVEFDAGFSARIAKGTGFLVKKAREAGGSQPSVGSFGGGSMRPPPAPSVASASASAVGRYVPGRGFSFSGFGGQL